MEDLRYEKEVVDVKAMRIPELEEQLQELRSANRGLEDKITRLCEAPFISDAFGQQESKQRIEDAMREREELRSKVLSNDNLYLFTYRQEVTVCIPIVIYTHF